MSSPWMTRREAAAYLRTSVQSIDRRLVEWQPRPIKKRLRFRRLDWAEDGAAPIRILAEDVYAALPHPEGDQAADDDLAPSELPKTIPGTFHR